MFKKMFGPKKHEAQGSPVSLEELKNELLAYFPQEAGINEFLTFESDEKVHDGFKAVWEYYMRERDEDGHWNNYLLKYSVFVDIRSDEKAVYFKNNRFARTKRVPKGTKRFDPWYTGISIGDLETVRTEYDGNFTSFAGRKKLKFLVEKTNQMGWDAYIKLL